MTDLNVNESRPIGITILAIVRYSEVAAAIIWAVLLLTAPVLLQQYFERYSFAYRLLLAILLISMASLEYFWARGLWRLRNWARRLEIGFGVVEMLPVAGVGGIVLPLWILPAGPVRQLTGCVVTLVVLVYVLSPSVAAAFGMKYSTRTWQFVVAAAWLLSMVFVLSKSREELLAYRWHKQHGNTITLNGVSFPIDRWSYPSKSDEGMGFEIEDNPGPLRARDRSFVLRVSGRRNEQTNQSANQLTNEQLSKFQKAGYTELKTFPLRIGEQTLACVQNGIYSTKITHCYGDGPIYSLYFAGPKTSWYRVEQMMSEAR